MSLLNIKDRLCALLYACLYLSITPLLAAVAITLKARELILSKLTGKKSHNNIDNENGRTVLITGGDRPAVSVHLARCMGLMGHRVVVTGANETWPQVAKSSKHIERYHSLSPAHVNGGNSYTNSLLRLIRRERAEWVISASSGEEGAVEAETLADMATRNKEVRYLSHENDHVVRKLQERSSFIAMAKEANLPVLQGKRSKLDRETTKCREFVANGICKQGKLILIQVCSLNPRRPNVVYENVEYPAIRSWMAQFCNNFNLTGCISVDFMEDPDSGIVSAETCRPTLHASFVAFPCGMAEMAFRYALDPDSASPNDAQNVPISAPIDSTPTYFLPHLLLKANPRPTMVSVISTLLRRQEAFLSPDDPCPFVVANSLSPFVAFVKCALSGRHWIKGYDHQEGVIV